MDYIQIQVTLNKVTPYIDVIKQELAIIYFDAFEDHDSGFSAYVPESKYDKQKLNLILNPYGEWIKTYEEIRHPYQNWNAVWEENFNPIRINEKCIIRSSFHPTSNLPFEIIINPEMSFGTGHHETTRLIARELFNVDINSKKVLDFGAGTAILSILAEKLGASYVDAVEIDDKVVCNAKKNVSLNNCSLINLISGDGESIPNMAYDLILVNINKNTIIEEFEHIFRVGKTDAVILFSGFFINDLSSIVNYGEKFGLIPLSSNTENEWSLLCMKFK